MNPGLTTIETAMREEIIRAVRICAPGWEKLGPLTFDDRPREQIEAWSTGVLMKHLLPALQQARDAMAGGGARELAATDAALNSVLAGPARRNSVDAGRVLAADRSIPSGERALSRYVAEIGGAKSPGHFAVLFGARTAVFHIPPRVALGALAFLELKHLPLEAVWPSIHLCLASMPESPASLRAA